jgi:hypothetical protein
VTGCLKEITFQATNLPILTIDWLNLNIEEALPSQRWRPFLVIYLSTSNFRLYSVQWWNAWWIIMNIEEALPSQRWRLFLVIYLSTSNFRLYSVQWWNAWWIIMNIEEALPSQRWRLFLVIYLSTSNFRLYSVQWWNAWWIMSLKGFGRKWSWYNRSAIMVFSWRDWGMHWNINKKKSVFWQRLTEHFPNTGKWTISVRW